MNDPESKVEGTSAPASDEATDASTHDDAKRSPAASRRRHFVWGLIVVLVGAAVGATVGWSSQVPVYRSEGVVYIEPSMPSLSDPGGQAVMPMFQSYVRFQVELLQQRRTTLLALESDAWQGAGGRLGPGAAEAFEVRRRIEHEPGTQHIRVLFLDPQPKVAQAGVQALIEAYRKLVREFSDTDDRLEYARTYIRQLNAKLEDKTRQILSLTREYGGVEALEVRHRDAVERTLEAEKELDSVRMRIAAYESVPDLPAEEIAIESPQMVGYLMELAQWHEQAELLAEKVTEQHSSMKVVRQKIRVLEARIARYVEEWNLRRERAANGGTTLEELKELEKKLAARVEALRSESRELGKIRVEVERLQAEREDLERKLQQMSALRDQLEAKLQGTGRIKIYGSGSLPTEPHQDDRTLYAWMGGVIGGFGALLLGLLVLTGARRVGRAAEATAYHARVREAVAMLPRRIGEWKGHDVEIPPAAARMPKPNLAIGREFSNPSTGEHATLRIVQCRDARDLSMYYPPVQYPADGWTLREAEPRNLPALMAAIPGTVYRFTKESAEGSNEVLVYNFFARPDGSIESGPVGALQADTHTQALGAAQFQILLGPTMAKDRRDEVFRTLIAAALPVMDALCVEEDDA